MVLRIQICRAAALLRLALLCLALLCLALLCLARLCSALLLLPLEGAQDACAFDLPGAPMPRRAGVGQPREARSPTGCGRVFEGPGWPVKKPRSPLAKSPGRSPATTASGWPSLLLSLGHSRESDPAAGGGRNAFDLALHLMLLSSNQHRQSKSKVAGSRPSPGRRLNISAHEEIAQRRRVPACAAMTASLRPAQSPRASRRRAIARPSPAPSPA